MGEDQGPDSIGQGCTKTQTEDDCGGESKAFSVGKGEMEKGKGRRKGKPVKVGYPPRRPKAKPPEVSA